MNTQMVVGIVAGFFVLAGGAYLLKGGESSPAAQNETASAPTAGAFSGSIADLSSRQGDWRCAIDTSTLDVISSGTVYISNGEVRGEFTTSIPNYGSVTGDMLVTGGYVYTWSSIVPNGLKTKVSAASEGGTQTEGGGMDANTSYSYDCQPWVADASKFSLPSSVTFVE